jgi:predicted DNA-binding transcriptional regulator AlpA
MKAKMQSSETLQIEPALLTIDQTCQLINVKRAHFYNLRASGKFAPLPVNLSRKVLYVRTEIESWIRAGLPHRKIWHNQRKENRL